MKLRTKIIAWLHILSFGWAFLIVLVLLLLGGGLLAGVLKPDQPEAGWLTVVAGLGVTTVGLLILGLVLLFMLPWVFLLKKRDWAWWLLTVVYGLQIAFALFVVVLAYPSRTKVTSEDLEISGTGLVWIITLLILLTDRPSQWKQGRRTRRHARR